MSGTDLRDLLTYRAGDAPLPPADLIERVEAGYRRRRRSQVALSAFAAVLVLVVAAWAGLGTPHQRASLPANLVNLPPLHLPPTLDKAPGISTAFPGSVIDGIPATTPSKLNTAVHGLLGPGHALLSDTKALYDYNAGSKTLRKITETGPAMTAVAATPHWVVWQQTDSANAGHFFVYKAPISGGPRQLVATVSQGPRSTTWYATDDDVYWTSLPGERPNTGVTRLSLKTGAISTVPGFEDLVVDGTPWAKGFDIPTLDYSSVGIAQSHSRNTMMRNLITGERRAVTTRDDTEWLRCVATFCLGQTRPAGPSPTTMPGLPSPLHLGGYFVQHPDGSDRVEIPYPGFPELLKTDDGGVLLFQLATATVLDPVRGKVGALFAGGKQPRCEITAAFGIRWSNGADPQRDCRAEH